MLLVFHRSYGVNIEIGDVCVLEQFEVRLSNSVGQRLGDVAKDSKLTQNELLSVLLGVLQGRRCSHLGGRLVVVCH